MTISNIEIPEFSIRYLNTTSLVGIVVFSLTSIAYYFGILSITRSSFIVFDRDLQYTNGTVVSIRKTSFGEGGETTHYPIFEIGFRYKVGNMICTNLGYTTSEDISMGDELDIVYKKPIQKFRKQRHFKPLRLD